MRFSAAIFALAAGVSALPASSSSQHESSYQEMALWHHNVHRYNHSVASLHWDTALAEVAQKKANSCQYNWDYGICSSLGYSCGGNRASGGGSTTEADFPNSLAQTITGGWYNSGFPYLPPNMGTSQTNPDMSEFRHWGELSQIVWKSSTKLGCGTRDCSSTGLGTFHICLYDVAGNMGLTHWDNVLPAQGWPTIYYSDGKWQSHKY